MPPVSVMALSIKSLIKLFTDLPFDFANACIFSLFPYEVIFAEIMRDTGATYDEAVLMCELDCSTLDEMRKYVAQEKEYNQLLIDLYPGNLQYLREEYVKEGVTMTEDALQAAARTFTDEQAYEFVYEQAQCNV